MNQEITRNKDTGFEWKTLPVRGRQEVNNLLAAFRRLHPTVANLLVQRGLSDPETVRNFFQTSPEIFETLGEMKDMDVAAERLNRAIDQGESILLYGDYDVDGTTSVAMMLLFLTSLDANVAYYIPDRYKEGYGLSQKGVEKAVSMGARLMITLDCGITAVEQVEKLNTAGIDTIICDHHLPGNRIPRATAILNPKQDDCEFLGKQLCGCGVAFFLIRKIAHDRGIPEREIRPYLQLTAIATCCDIVPMTGVNRAIVANGLPLISSEPLQGIISLLNSARFKSDSLDVSDVVFKIGPRINAAGRLRHASLGVELLCAASSGETDEIAREIELLNTERKSLDENITSEALAEMEKLDPLKSRKSIVLAKSGWHKGLVGIVASRLMEKCYRPTIVLTEHEGLYTGSARSVEGFNLHAALGECSHLLAKYGGHALAAGLSLIPENLEKFREAFEKVASRELAHASNRPVLHIDLEVDFPEWHNENYVDFFDQLSRFQPYGPGNLAPLFATRKVRAADVKIVGKDHLKLSVFQDSNPISKLPAIAFYQAEKFKEVASNAYFDIAYTIESNTWNDKRTIQLNVKEIRV